MMGAVDPGFDAGQIWGVLTLGQKINPMPARLRQPLHQLPVLAGHILVHKEKIHQMVP
jgi:hypothetical protein